MLRNSPDIGCRCRLTILVCVFLLMGVDRVAAETPLSIASLHYESPALIAPVVVLLVPTDPYSEWLFGLEGWTVGARRFGRIDSGVSTLFSTEITPLNSHASDYIYVDGERASGLAYRNATLEAKAGLRIEHAPKWHTDLLVVGLYERVGDLSAELSDFWERPFLGVEVGHGWRRIRSYDFLGHRWDGIDLAGAIQAFSGSAPWWRASLSAGLGQKVGRFFFHQSGALFAGNPLNIVNQFLIGGSWDLPGVNPLHGHHYAEFRVERALLLGAGVGIRFFDRWELGVHAAYLDSPTTVTYGEAIRISAVLSGIYFNLGVSFPENALFHGELDRAIVHAGATFALFEPWKSRL